MKILRFLLLALALLALCPLTVSAGLELGASMSISTGQQALSTTAALIAAADNHRRSIVIDNHDAAISIYVGAAGVTTTTGKLVRAGQAITINTRAAVYAISASGTPTISYLIEND